MGGAVLKQRRWIAFLLAAFMTVSSALPTYATEAGTEPAQPQQAVETVAEPETEEPATEVTPEEETQPADEAGEDSEEVSEPAQETPEEPAEVFEPIETQEEEKPVPGKLSIAEGEEKGTYVVTLSGAKLPGGIERVTFPTWSSEKDQDDIVWYDAQLKDDAYVATIDLAKHKHLGKFLVHAYAAGEDGKLIKQDQLTFDAKVPSGGKVEVVANSVNHDKGTFQVKMTGLVGEENAQKVQFAVWCKKGQSDIKWYDATKDKDGSYVVTVDLANHKNHVGDYSIHAYVKDIQKKMVFQSATTQDMGAKVKKVYADASKDKEKTFVVHADEVEIPAGAQKIQFAVWSKEKNQDDLVWYDASRSGKNYTATVSISKHKHFGAYYVHAYAKLKSGEMQFLGSTTFTATAPSGKVVTNAVNGSAGTFGCIGTNLKSVSGFSKIQFAVWCSGDQSDIRWYTATKQKDGNYTQVVNVSNHKNHFGTYKVHMYGTTGNGKRQFLSATTVKIAASNYIYATKASAGGDQYTITILNPNVDGKPATKVQVPTWSTTGDQDDIVWYNATKSSGTTWTVTVKSTNHKHSGTYLSHVYANGKKIGGTSYSMVLDPERATMINRAQSMYSSTGKLILVSKSSHRVGIFTGSRGNWTLVKYWPCGDGAPSTPTPEGVFHVGSKGAYFDTSGGNRCHHYTQIWGSYYFHSVLYRASNGSLSDGRLGMALSHGCVRLARENALWLQQNCPSGTTILIYR